MTGIRTAAEWVPALRCIAEEALHRVRDTTQLMATRYSAGPANSNRLPSGSLTMKFFAPQGCRFSV